jgi:hypothetical protein
MVRKLGSEEFFAMNSVHKVFEDISGKIKADVEAIPREQLLQADVDELAQQFVVRYAVECASLAGAATVEELPFAPSVQYPTVAVHFPISGNPQVFNWQDVTHPVINGQVEFKPTEILLRMRIDPDRHFDRDVKAKVGHVREQLEGWLAAVRDKLKLFNPSIKDSAKNIITRRLAEFAKHRSMTEKIEKTGFRLHRRDDGAERIIVPVKPKEIKIVAPQAAAKADACAELSVADYDAILQLIQDMVRVFERSPSTFRKMQEEELRTILLVALNGVFKGNATGETFNGDGKTDIMIRVNNNNIFIAECLIWDGPEHFKKKLSEQLFGYSTWHDSKLAAIVFNRNKKITEVVEKMREAVASLDNCVGPVTYKATSGCRHRFRRQDDPQKEFLLTCLAFEVPT